MGAGEARPPFAAGGPLLSFPNLKLAWVTATLQIVLGRSTWPYVRRLIQSEKYVSPEKDIIAVYLLIHITLILSEIRKEDIQVLILARLLHVLFHSSQEPIFGLDMIRELEQRDRPKTQ
jgi:hypothetical protein